MAKTKSPWTAEEIAAFGEKMAETGLRWQAFAKSLKAKGIEAGIWTYGGDTAKSGLGAAMEMVGRFESAMLQNGFGAPDADE